jgi:hypothetical protein
MMCPAALARPEPILTEEQRAAVAANNSSNMLEIGSGDIGDPEVALPAVPHSLFVADVEWFSAHPDRKFRSQPAVHGTWIIRRRPQGDDPDVFLRVITRSPVRLDTEGELARIWYATAFSDWPPGAVLRAARKAIKKAPR